MSHTASVDGVEGALQSDNDELTSDQVAELAGITYRQLDYWARAGHIPDPAARAKQGGSGHARRWTRTDAARVAEVAGMVRAGFTVGAAARYAEEATR